MCLMFAVFDVVLVVRTYNAYMYMYVYVYCVYKGQHLSYW